MESHGLLHWANSIRLTMATDPGRLVFKEQVQTHGFMFLDDYLENIVSGAKADPLIELVKTPGRKRAITRKPKLMTSKLNANMFTVHEDTNDDENTIPAHSDNVSSIKAESIANETTAVDKSQDTVPNGHSHTESPLTSLHSSSKEESRPSPRSSENGTLSVSQDPLAGESISPTPPVVPSTIKPALRPSKDYNDLSMIEEDDETSERGRQSMGDVPEVKSISTQTTTTSGSTKPRLSELMQDVVQEEPIVTSRSSSSSMHSIALDSFNDQTDQINSADEPSKEVPISNVDEIDDVSQKPLYQDEDIDMAMTDPSAADTHPAANIDKPATSVFPTLPEPMALIKPRAPSLNAATLGSATPGGALGGKRSSSSWLMKTRERKALEVPLKKASSSKVTIVADPVPSMAHSTKRKSGDSAAEEDERHTKVHKTLEGSSAPFNSIDSTDTLVPVKESVSEDTSQQGVYDRLKKTVEGFGIRTSKPLNKSLGGMALAEAKAAAEAKVAERDRKEEEMTMAIGAPSVPAGQPVVDSSGLQKKHQDRLSISDLFPSEGKVREKDRVREKPFQFTPSFTPTRNKEKEREVFKAHERTSTTPIHSPPPRTKSKLPQNTAPSQPAPVFVPPAPIVTKPPIFEPPGGVFKPPTAIKTAPSSSLVAAPLTAQSTLETVQSDDLFDDTIPPWQPSTQDTDYTSAYDTQSQPQTQLCDDDDSWPMDEKLAAGVQWAYGASKEDSMTWSTLPSQSQRVDTGPLTSRSLENNYLTHQEIPQPTEQGVRGSSVDPDGDNVMHGDKADELDDPELDNAIIGSKAATPPVEPKIPRSQSQLSMTSSSSSQSQGGFLTQATKLLSSALGTNKKKQPEVKKVLQMAASAAKKQQEEADKKTSRLKDMEMRRQQALQRKAEEEKAKSLSEERKLREDAEKRKREREKDDQTDKRVPKPSGSKKEEDTQKKRKIEIEKKTEMKKPGPSVLNGKPQMKSALKQPSSHTFGGSTTVAESSTSLAKGKSPGVQQPIMHENELSQPSHLLQSQMAARAKAKLDAARKTEPLVPSESIELPDINSEYSDSEDEDRVRTFDPPEWAQSPELRQALEVQSTVNPDEIFGPVRPLRMEEIFKTRTSRFRARSSSANWTGTDRLTMQEETEYARRMGFK